MGHPTVRRITDSDLGVVLGLNQANVPAVGPVDRDGLAQLVAWSETAVLAEVDGSLSGFVIALPPGMDYGSPNYRWFSERYDDFVYVDRIAVDEHRQGGGLGHLLYDTVEEATDAAVFCCEVNLRPRNEPSLRFHQRRGFEAVGEQDTDGGTKRVVLFAKELT